MKKIIIGTLDAGSGHNSAQKSLVDALSHHKDLKVVTFCSHNDALDKIYSTIVNTFEPAHKLMYDLGQYEELSFLSFESQFETYAECKKTIKANNPDVIISTHPILSALFVRARNSLKASCKVISVAPDYGSPHRTYFPKDSKYQADRLWVISDESYDAAINQLKIPKEKVDRIAIRPPEVFIKLSSQKKSKNEWREELIKNLPSSAVGSLKSNVFTVLLQAGGSWIIKLFGIIEKLEAYFDTDWPEFQVIIICGKNAQIYNELSEKIRKSETKIRYTVFNFIPHEQIALTQLASDVVVLGSLGGAYFRELIYTQPGPLLMHDYIAGQEEPHAKMIGKLEIGKFLQDEDTVIDEIIRLAQGKNVDFYNSCRKNLMALKKDHEKYSKRIYEIAKEI